jgi:Restriction Enzyme Adenine Methylase Associated/Protein of unknown function (DUF2924)
MGKIKNQHLLVQHLEGVSWRLLDSHPHLIRGMIRHRSGVYALHRKEKLYYVGLANNLMGRINSHLRDRHRGLWDRFSVYLTVQDDHIKELESLVLRITKPAGNKQVGKFVRSENLISALNRRMSDDDADRRARLLGGSVARRRRRAKTRKTTGTLVLAGVVEKRFPLRATRQGQEYRATVRTDGRISYRGRRYDSPTAAAKAATGTSRNGWTFWRYRNERGQWVRLKYYRR